jgi:hypothetical protein
MLRLGSMNGKEKESRDQPKELWIHGRAYLRAMDMPQSKRNENRYFFPRAGEQEWRFDYREGSDLIHPLGDLEICELSCGIPAAFYRRADMSVTDGLNKP